MKLTQLSTACALAATTLFAASAHAQISGDVIKIGFITDLSGLYADIDGPAGAEAIRMAIADLGGAINGKKIWRWQKSRPRRKSLSSRSAPAARR